MKKVSQTLSTALIVFLMMIVPMVTMAQAQSKESPKKEAAKTETPKASKCEKAPSHSYWGFTAYGALDQFNGDLSKNILFNDKWMFGAGGSITKQFSRVIGARFRGGWVPLSSSVTNKFVPEATTNPDGLITQSFKSWVIEADLEATINWVNWIMGYKPERFFSSYIIAGIGADHTQGAKFDENGIEIGYLGYPSHLTDDPGSMGYGNNSGIGKWNLEFKAVAGLGFDFNLSKHWSINPEILWRWRDGDVLDMTPGGAKQVLNDMYSSVNLGITYKFAYSGCNLKEMAKNYSLIKYETTPAVLSEKGDSIVVTVKGTVPPKFFCPTAAMYFHPVLTYEGGQYELPCGTHLYGEKLTGEGTMIKYKEGGSFTYTCKFPYKPEFNTSQLTVAPIIYEAKEKVLLKKDEIKVKAKFMELPVTKLAPGVIYTSKRVQHDEFTAIADHGYQKEVFQSKTGAIYFKKNKFDLDMKFGLNKTDPAKAALADLNTFVKQGWKIKDIAMNGYASPEGEETYNANLSENRSKSGNQWMTDQFQGWAKDANKDNKDKKAVKAAVEAAGKDVNMTLQHHGPDWNGFLKAVQNSSMKDKDKVLNVINSNVDAGKKEQEIRNMILIYPEIEKDLLPALRRSEITATLLEPRMTDAELLQYGASNPEKLKVEELLYAATLTKDNNVKVTILENAAKQFPANWKALNNAAVAEIEKGNLTRANELLTSAQAAQPNNGIIENNIGVVAAKQKDLKKAEAQFKKAATLGENTNYNQGVLMIPKGDYPKAVNMLGNAKCTYNLGLAQLLSGNNAAAETTLKCAPESPETFYLLAVTAARANNSKGLYEYLMKACAKADLKTQARTDREFLNFSATPEFQNIVK
jgi:Flp pilus assembly protein TadD/outer membrane protein OmpA-like peptidoglycan-associated protein